MSPFLTYTYNARDRIVMNSSGVRTTYTSNVAQELISFLYNTGTTNITFDANGNQVVQTAPSGARTTWAWDFENRLTQVQLSTGIRNTFAYNADNKRVFKQDSTGTTQAVWDLENILLETNQSNVTQAEYTLEPAEYGNQLSQCRANVSQFYLFDGLGSGTCLVSATGTITDTYLYQAFGISVNGTGTSINPYRFIAIKQYYYDVELATYYVRA